MLSGGMGVIFSLTGIIIPRGQLPGVLADVGALLPISHALSGFRDAFQGQGVSAVSSQFGLEVAVGIAYLGIGYAWFLIIEARGHRTGALDVSTV